MNIHQMLHSVVEPAVNDWFRRQMANPYAAFYLYARKAREGERIAVPVIAEEAPSDEFFLATPERISIGWTKERAQQFCYENLLNQPILGNLDQE